MWTTVFCMASSVFFCLRVSEMKTSYVNSQATSDQVSPLAKSLVIDAETVTNF